MLYLFLSSTHNPTKTEIRTNKHAATTSKPITSNPSFSLKEFDSAEAEMLDVFLLGNAIEFFEEVVDIVTLVVINDDDVRVDRTSFLDSSEGIKSTNN